MFEELIGKTMPIRFQASSNVLQDRVQSPNSQWIASRYRDVMLAIRRGCEANGTAGLPSHVDFAIQKAFISDSDLM